MTQNLRTNLFNEFLNYFWLRPENALIFALKGEKLLHTKKFIKENSMDVACGNGIFCFITFGGKVKKNEDMYLDLNLKKKDIYDQLTKSKKKIILRSPNIKFSYGTDWKTNLLQKSKSLDIYSKTLLHDNNKPFNFKNGHFDYIYSSSAYWVKNFEMHIHNLLDILKPGGKLILTLKTSELIKYTMKNLFKNNFDNSFYKILDNGREKSWKGLRNLNQYHRVFKNYKNCKINSQSPIYDSEIAYFWDVGLRPIIRPLTYMSNNLTSKHREISKEMFVERWSKILSGYLKNYVPNENKTVEWIFEIEKL